MGKRRDEASLCQRKGGRPIPGGQSLLTAMKAVWALASLLTKSGVLETEGVNQYPGHITSTLGWKTDPSWWTGALEMGSMSVFVRQWMSSVLGTERRRPSLAPLALSLAYCFYRIWMLCR